jgi:hypothetical protein
LVEVAKADIANVDVANNADEADKVKGLDNQLGGANVIEINEIFVTESCIELDELVAAEAHA